MINKYKEEDIKDIIKLGSLVNKKFEKLFNINNLPDNEEILVYKENNQVIGFLHYLDNIDYIEFLNVAVHEEKRNKKIASLLVDYFLSQNNKRIILEVRESNLPAIKLYKKFNFFIINIREKYYGNENAIIMERSSE